MLRGRIDDSQGVVFCAPSRHLFTEILFCTLIDTDREIDTDRHQENSVFSVQAIERTEIWFYNVSVSTPSMLSRLSCSSNPNQNRNCCIKYNRSVARMGPDEEMGSG